MATALYIHIPFCRQKCRYCSFVSAPLDERVPFVVQALAHEMYRYPAGTEIDTVFFGGGTPSALPDGSLPFLLKKVRAHFAVSPSCEITAEANPESIRRSLLDAWAEAGINRISLGVQSSSEHFLRMLGRLHTFEQAQQAIKAVYRAGFRRMNADLMYALPGQSTEDFEKDMHAVLDLGITHLSCYALSIEPGTPLHEMALSPQDDDIAAEQWEAAGRICAAYGLSRYEISNYAAPGEQCRHNLHYWRNEPYIGIGPAAHGARIIDGCWTRTANTSDINAYLCGNAPVQTEMITPEEERFESIMLETRTTQGLRLQPFAERYGISFSAVYASAIEKTVGEGLARLSDTHYSLTERGMLLQNRVLLQFLE